jgi:S-layer homology domain
MKPVSRLFVAACMAASFVAVGTPSASAQVPGEAALGPAAAAEQPEAPEPWGTTTLNILSINAFAFETFDGASVHKSDSTGGRYMVSGNSCFEAGLNLPTGAVVDHLQLDSCDTGVGEVSAGLATCPIGGSPCVVSLPIATSGTPGCALNNSAIGTAAVNNNLANYFVQACTAGGASTTFHAVRVFYHLQVSPAPAVATFPVDVPTGHPFFRFVEAMAASGLTGGCGPGQFCPDTPVTRGQLSVFLASALGLHFPN